MGIYATDYKNQCFWARRLIVTRSVQANVRYLKEQFALEPKAGKILELKPYQIQRDNSDLEKLLSGLL